MEEKELLEIIKKQTEDQFEKLKKTLDADATKVIEKHLEGLTELKDFEDFKTDLDKQLLDIKAGQETKVLAPSVKEAVNTFIKDNAEKISQMLKAGQGLIKLDVLKVVGDMTTGSATNPDGIPIIQGVQIAPPSTINYRLPFVLGLTTNFNTNQSSFAYTETLPKDGDFTFLAEGGTKLQTDFVIETRYAAPVKTAAWVKLTDEAVTDIPQMQSITNDLLRKKHDLKKQSGILFGDGIAPNPKGATVYGRVFSAGGMALAVATPNFMDVVNACVTDIYTTHNFQDEMAYQPSIAMVNPEDFYIELVSAKDADGHPLFPTASLFNQVTLGGVTIIPERSVPLGKIFVADMSMYNTTNYIPYNVQIGWINDDFIKNQFVILAESRFHAFVRKFDEQAFIYDTIATIKAAITKP